MPLAGLEIVLVAGHVMGSCREGGEVWVALFQADDQRVVVLGHHP